MTCYARSNKIVFHTFDSTGDPYVAMKNTFKTTNIQNNVFSLILSKVLFQIQAKPSLYTHTKRD